MPYNDHCNIDYFAKRKADTVWTVSGGVHDAIVIHFADDLYTVPDEKQNRRVYTVPHVQILPVFKRLHVGDSGIVQAVKDMPYGMSKKYGRRPRTTLKSPSMNMVRSLVTFPLGFKGHTHCNQRVFAAALHLIFSIPKHNLDSLFTCAAMMNLGTDADARDMNVVFRCPSVCRWLELNTDRELVPELQRPVIGDKKVRHMMKNLPTNTAMYTYPVDYRGVGRHCMLVYKPRFGPVVIWDPSPTFDNEAECPVRTAWNEAALNVMAYAEGRMLAWKGRATDKTRKNRRRDQKRMRSSSKKKRAKHE